MLLTESAANGLSLNVAEAVTSSQAAENPTK